MKWFIYKFRQLKKWFLYFILYRSSWKKLFVSESDNSKWEIIHDSDNKKVELIYVPEDDYSTKDIKIEMSYEDFEDLVKFMIKIR